MPLPEIFSYEMTEEHIGHNIVFEKIENEDCMAVKCLTCNKYLFELYKKGDLVIH